MPPSKVQGRYSGSIRGFANQPFSGKLSFREAIERGLAYNLGEVGLLQAVNQAQGQARVSRSAMLPNLTGDLQESVQQTNLKALGVRIQVPGFSSPTIVGPFNYIDLRARLSQSVIDLTALNNYKAARESSRAAQLSAQKARDLVDLRLQVESEVRKAYLDMQAAANQVGVAQKNIEVAKEILDLTRQKVEAGVSESVEFVQTQQSLASADLDYINRVFAHNLAKLSLARALGRTADVLPSFLNLK